MNHELVEWFVDQVVTAIHKQESVDGVFVSLHGATQSTEHDVIGEKAVISVSLDMHATSLGK